MRPPPWRWPEPRSPEAAPRHPLGAFPPHSRKGTDGGETSAPSEPAAGHAASPGGRVGAVDRRLPHPAASGLRRAGYLWHPGRLRAHVLRHARKEPDQHGRMHARGLRRFCRRRLRSGERHRGGLRDVRGRRAERVQLDRRGLCREVARRAHQRLAGSPRAIRKSALAPSGGQIPHAVRGVSLPLRRQRRAARPGHGVPRDRPRVGRRGSPPAARLPRAAPRHGPRGSRGPPHTRVHRAQERPGRAGRGPGRGHAADRREPSAGDPGGRGDPSPRAPGPAPGAGRGGGNPHHHDDVGKERDQRDPSAVCRHLRRGHGPRGGYATGRNERLRDRPRRVPDRHQHGDLHGQAGPR